MKAKRIDAFMLSAPAPYLLERDKVGTVILKNLAVKAAGVQRVRLREHRRAQESSAGRKKPGLVKKIAAPLLPLPNPAAAAPADYDVWVRLGGKRRSRTRRLTEQALEEDLRRQEEHGVGQHFKMLPPPWLLDRGRLLVAARGCGDKRRSDRAGAVAHHHQDTG